MEKVRVYIAFGVGLVKAIYRNDIESVETYADDTDALCVREFDTEAEAKAYMMGMDDNAGWNDYARLSESDPFEKQVINLINNQYYA